MMVDETIEQERPNKHPLYGIFFIEYNNDGSIARLGRIFDCIANNNYIVHFYGSFFEIDKIKIVPLKTMIMMRDLFEVREDLIQAIKDREVGLCPK